MHIKDILRSENTGFENSLKNHENKRTMLSFERRSGLKELLIKTDHMLTYLYNVDLKIYCLNELLEINIIGTIFKINKHSLLFCTQDSDCSEFISLVSLYSDSVYKDQFQYNLVFQN